jgi:anti-anti-sigma factor
MAHPHTADRLRLGDHVCWTFDRDDDRLTGMAEVVEAGVRRNEKVLYLTESLLPTALLAGLEARGGEAGGASGRGQLVIDNARDTYLVGGRFDPDATIDALDRHITRALDEGWAGLRVIGDMAWASRADVREDHLTRFEAAANRLFTRRRAMAVCQYDQRLFSAAKLRQASAAHPGSTAVESGVVWAPLLRMERTPAGLRVAGEADMSNRGALSAVLDALVEEHRDGERPAVVDLSGLTFADAASVGLLLRVTAELPCGVRIVGCRPTVARMLALLGADEVPGLTVTEGGR